MGRRGVGRATVTAPIIRKAARLVVDGRVQARGCAAIFRVQGDSDTYTVAVGDDWHSCSCPAVGVCSHILAAMYLYDDAVNAPVVEPVSILERSAA